MNARQVQCPECGSYGSVVAAAVPGLDKCRGCGKVFAPPPPKPLADMTMAELYAVADDLGVDYVEGAIVKDDLIAAIRRAEQEPEAPDSPESNEALESGAESGVSVPDMIEVATGWRAWGVKLDLAPGETPVLQSVTYNAHFWTPRAPMVATCPHGRGRANGVQRNGKHPKEGVPGESCSCGLYSAKDYDHLMGMAYHRYDAERSGLVHVIGKVKLWGKVIEGTQGWRAEIGYPAELYVPYEAWKMVEPLKEAYGVPVMLKNILERRSR